MSNYFIAPIVEGHGEVQAVPILLQRLLFNGCYSDSEFFNPRALRPVESPPSGILLALAILRHGQD